MLCYHCEKANDCSVLKELCSVSENFSINKCNNFHDSLCYSYMKIAENHDLMRLIYDYFMNLLEGCSKKDAEEAIVRTLQNLSQG